MTLCIFSSDKKYTAEVNQPNKDNLNEINPNKQYWFTAPGKDCIVWQRYEKGKLDRSKQRESLMGKMSGSDQESLACRNIFTRNNRHNTRQTTVGTHINKYHVAWIIER